MKKLKNLIVSFELRNPVAAVILLAVYALSGRFANGHKHPLGTMKLAALGVLLLLLPALLVSGPGVARGQGCTVPNVVGRYKLSGARSELLVIDSQSGNHVSGRYGKDENSMVNTIEGDFLTGDQCNVLSGTFTNTQYNTNGTFTYTFSGDGTGFSGSWEDNKGYTGGWSGTREGVAVEHCKLSASLANCPQPLVLKDNRRSEVCEICIYEWCRNTANPVRVILPQQLDWWGTNAPGIKVFAGGKEEPPDAPLSEIISPMTVEPSNMSGYRCWDSLYGTYPWNLFVRAEEGAPAGVIPIPIEVRQKIPGTDRDTVVNLIMQVMVPGGGGRVAGQLTGTFAIQTVNGNYLNAVNGGGVFGAGAIHTDATKIDAWETFNLIPLGDGKYAIQTVNGNYLTANGGGVFGQPAIHTDATKIDAWEKFTLQNLDGDTYAIQTINGNYLTALSGGGMGGGQVTIHTDATKIDAREKFRLIKLGE